MGKRDPALEARAAGEAAGAALAASVERSLLRIVDRLADVQAEQNEHREALLEFADWRRSINGTLREIGRRLDALEPED